MNLKNEIRKARKVLGLPMAAFLAMVVTAGSASATEEKSLESSGMFQTRKTSMMSLLKKETAELKKLEGESELESETESELEREGLLEDETESELEREGLQEDETESEIESESESEAESETEEPLVYVTESELESETESIFVVRPFQPQTEPETESELETETETETEESEEIRQQKLQQSLLHFLAYMPNEFRFPMMLQPEEEKYHEPVSFENSPTLHYCHPVFLHGEEAVLEQKFAFHKLEQRLEQKLGAYEGEWSVYLKNLDTDDTLWLNQKPMKSASVMKLFVMGTVYEAMENGSLARTDEIMNYMNNMISHSDNESTNQLLFRLGNESYARGIAKVNEFIQSHGYSEDTIEYNGFSNANTVVSPGKFNQVTAEDCGKLLEDVYRRTWMSRAVSEEIEDMMLKQGTRYKIPAGLPGDVLCGNKTGELDTTENDAAIVYSKACDYILVVLSSDWNDKNGAQSRIAEVSKLVYEFYNNDLNT